MHRFAVSVYGIIRGVCDYFFASAALTGICGVLLLQEGSLGQAVMHQQDIFVMLNTFIMTGCFLSELFRMLSAKLSRTETESSPSDGTYMAARCISFLLSYALYHWYGITNQTPYSSMSIWYLVYIPGILYITEKCVAGYCTHNNNHKKQK